MTGLSGFAAGKMVTVAVFPARIWLISSSINPARTKHPAAEQYENG
jgi:hypothetical protein